MTVFSWPTAAKIVSMGLTLQAPQTSNTSPLNQRQMRGARRAELWGCEVELVPMAPADFDDVSAFIEAQQGRYGACAVPLDDGFVNHADPPGPALVKTATAGAETIALDFSVTGVTLAAGTLLQIGAVTEEYTQLVECLADVTTSTNTTVSIAPRLRKGYEIYTVVQTSGVLGRFRLLADDSGAGVLGLGYGTRALQMVEVPYMPFVGFDRLTDDNGDPLQDALTTRYLTESY